MDKIFGILILSFIFTSILSIPFINLLYKLRFRFKRVRSKGRGPKLSKLHRNKVGTPTGGGILMIMSAFLFSILFYWVTEFEINWTAIILFLTMFLFGLLGFYDDIRKMFRVHGRHIKALPAVPKFAMQFACAGIIGYFLMDKLGITSIQIPMIDNLFGMSGLELGWGYVPFAAFIIVASSNAFNITDGLDGLATGLLLIALSAFWYIATFSVYAGDVMLFIAVIMGALLAFLYFNIFPARIFMGDTGSMALGAMLAVVALMTDSALVLPIIGGVFLVELLSSLIQILSKRFRHGKKVFKIAPIHFHFQALGWDETKVTMRFWLFGAVLAFIGVFIASVGM